MFFFPLVSLASAPRLESITYTIKYRITVVYLYLIHTQMNSYIKYILVSVWPRIRRVYLLTITPIVFIFKDVLISGRPNNLSTIHLFSLSHSLFLSLSQSDPGVPRIYCCRAVYGYTCNK